MCSFHMFPPILLCNISHGLSGRKFLCNPAVWLKWPGLVRPMALQLPSFVPRVVPPSTTAPLRRVPKALAGAVADRRAWGVCTALAAVWNSGMRKRQKEIKRQKKNQPMKEWGPKKLRSGRLDEFGTCYKR